MKLSRTIEINFNWWNNEQERELEYWEQEFLESKAEQRIFKMRAEGITSGELHEEIDGVTYQGRFEINYI